MIRMLEHTAQCGIFYVGGDSIELKEPDVVFPLVKWVSIGRPAHDNEQELLSGNLSNVIGYLSRASYNGSKLIVPKEEGSIISPYQGSLNPVGNKLRYRHATDNSPTVIWTPEGGIQKILAEDGDEIVLNAVDGKQHYLLLGGKLLGGKKRGGSLEDMFIHGYYVSVSTIRTNERKSKSFRI